MLAAEQLDVFPGLENVSAVAVLGMLMWFVLNKVCKRLDDMIKELDEIKDDCRNLKETTTTTTVKKGR